MLYHTMVYYTLAYYTMLVYPLPKLCSLTTTPRSVYIITQPHMRQHNFCCFFCLTSGQR